MANPPLDPPSSFSTSSSQHHESNNRPNQQLYFDQPFFGYMVQLTPALFFTNNANDSEQNLRQPWINSPAYYVPIMIYPVYNLPVVAMPENFRIPHMTDSSYHNSQENLEVELQMGRDDSSVLLDMEDSYSGDTEAFSEQVYNEIPNPDEVGDDESPGISTTASFTLFGVDIPVQQQANRSAMQVPESNHPSVVHDYPEEEVAMIVGTVLDFRSNGFDSDYDDPIFDEYDLEPEEQMGQVDSGLSEETIMKHIQKKYYLRTTTLSLNEERDICVICQSEFEYGEFIGGLHCGHKYHEQCIKKWLQQMNNCPICKATAVP